MGMFDTIKCEYKLPDGSLETDFQTKDLESCLETYSITKDGRLTLNGRDQDFHGDLNFYTATEDKTWLEYTVRFTEGQLTRFLVVTARSSNLPESPGPG